VSSIAAFHARLLARARRWQKAQQHQQPAHGPTAALLPPSSRCSAAHPHDHELSIIIIVPSAGGISSQSTRL
jgi:hypothetical protein